MNWIEMLGWVATGVTLISMMVKDMKLLRGINSMGCLLWISYGILKGDTPLIVVNSTILIIHIVSLIRYIRK
jgi:uncharacterized protein with PQ loop repeat